MHVMIKDFENKYPHIRPPIPKGAEYNGFEQAKPKINPATQPKIGPFDLENIRTQIPAYRTPMSVPKGENLAIAATVQAKTEYRERV